MTDTPEPPEPALPERNSIWVEMVDEQQRHWLIPGEVVRYYCLRIVAVTPDPMDENMVIATVKNGQGHKIVIGAQKFHTTTEGLGAADT